MTALKITNSTYNKMIATGGIGSGIYFALDGDHDLGRNESRMAKRMPGRDYCKGHIIAHYVSLLLGDAGTVHAIGAVGNDDAGRTLIQEMQSAGIQTEHVHIKNDANTLYAVCFQYPDSSGGNISEGDSASEQVSPSDVEACIAQHPLDKQSIVLAVPEVPMATRIALLKAGKDAGSLCVASFTSDEADSFIKADGVQHTDIIAINSDEAQAIIESKDQTGAALAQAAYDKLNALNKKITLSVTLGKAGAVVISDNTSHTFDPILTEVKSSGGAGDAYTAGLILGLCAGLPIDTAPSLGILLSSHSVTSFDTINFSSNAQSLKAYATSQNVSLAAEVKTLLG